MRLPEFLQQQLQPKQGPIIEIPQNAPIYDASEPDYKDKLDELHHRSRTFAYTVEDGHEVGTHTGAHFFTIGQRKGLAVGGTPDPLFVIDTDVAKNIIYAGQGKTHPGLFRSVLLVDASEVHWVRPDLKLAPGETLKVMARIRYRQPLQKAELFMTQEGLYVQFDRPQSAITSGQFVAWYQDDELLGSGVIA